MVQGSAWMTMGSMVSRVLGIIYVIPWLRMIGTPEEANTAQALYYLGYTYYAAFITIATAGFPSAIAKQIAEHNAEKKYKTSHYIFKVVTMFMIVMGALFAVIFWLIAPRLAGDSPVVDTGAGVQVIRSLAPALLLIPVMSTFRGYFQGFQEMKSSAISQIVEQFARIIFILSATFIIRIIMDGSIVNAVTYTTFSAFVGALASMVILYFYYRKYQPAIGRMIESDASPVSTNWKSILTNMLKEGIPFVIVGSIISITQIIDTNTFRPIMESVSSATAEEIQTLFAIFNGNINKLIMIIISLAVSMTTAQLPIISSAYQQKRIESIRKMIQSNLALYFFVMLPATAGMTVVAKPLYYFFYRYSEVGPNFIISACFMALATGLFLLLSGIMQAMSKHMHAIIGLVLGIIAKALLQYPLVAWLQTHGVFWSSTIGFLVSCLYYLFYLKKEIGLSYTKSFKPSIPIIFLTLVMIVVAFVVNMGVEAILPGTGTLISLLKLTIVAAIGGGAYVVLALVTHIADFVIGDQASRLRRKLHLGG